MIYNEETYRILHVWFLSIYAEVAIQTDRDEVSK